MTRGKVLPQLQLNNPENATNAEVFNLMLNRLMFLLEAVRTVYGETSESSKVIEYAIQKAGQENNLAALHILKNLREIPVTIETFVTSKEFLGDQIDTLWPNTLNDLKEINPYIFDPKLEPVEEVILAGAIGTAKSFIATVGTQYMLYVLNCFHHPQLIFGLNKHTEIVITIQSTKEGVAKRVLFEPLRDGYLAMPYCQKFGVPRHDKDQKNRLIFPTTKVSVIPMTATPTAYIGQAVIGGIVDEINFMQYVEQSKQIAGARGKGGLYDQAELIYSTLKSRRTSRFLNRNVSLGVLYLVSSVHYTGDFLERRIRELDPEKDKKVKVIRRKQYEAQPADQYCGKTFRFAVGDENYPSRIIDTREEINKKPKHIKTYKIPIEYYDQFRRNPELAQREVLGIATTAIDRFITAIDKVFDSFNRRKRNYKQLFNRDLTELETQHYPVINPNHIAADREAYRWIHVDLSKNKDRCGIAMVKVKSWIKEYDTVSNLVSVVPTFSTDFCIGIKPTKLKPLDLSEIRKLILTLKLKYGYNIRYVTYDTFQSTESIQLLNKAGIRAETLSVDRTSEPYEVFKDLITSDRVDIPHNAIIQEELLNLERNDKKGKIDHPPNGCFSEDTRVLLADGTSIEIKDIKHKDKIITYDIENNQVKIAEALNPRITKHTDDLVIVEMEDGTEFKCTPDHRFLLTNGKYKEAQYLTEEDDIQSLH
jgi:hypothetical protein